MGWLGHQGEVRGQWMAVDGSGWQEDGRPMAGDGEEGETVILAWSLWLSAG